MIRVGITGGIGSGKTTICQIFETMNIPIYYSDDRAKYLMNHNASVKTKICSVFGESAYNENGLDRAYLANIVFKDKKKLEKLNSIVHPAVHKDVHEWSRKHKTAYCLQEAALLFENGSHKQLDYLITVTAPLEVRISRVLQRDNTTKEQILARVNNQWTDEQRVPLSDFVINNDGRQALVPQIWKIHQQLLDISQFPKIV